jgi:hypothetical protein
MFSAGKIFRAWGGSIGAGAMSIVLKLWSSECKLSISVSSLSMEISVIRASYIG